MNDELPTVYYPLSVLDELMQEDEVADLLAKNALLRAQNADLRLMVDGLENAAHEERAAVVAWLRGCAQAHDGLGSRGTGNLLRTLSEAIERGEHRREEEP